MHEDGRRGLLVVVRCFLLGDTAVGLVAAVPVCAFCCHGDEREGVVGAAGDGVVDPAALARAAIDLDAHA